MDTKNEYKGFLHIICNRCGKEHTFFTPKGIDFYWCSCGYGMNLQKPKIAWVHCECGKNAKYKTNSNQKVFDIPCIECGMPTTVEYHRKKMMYVTIRNRY